MHIGIFGEEDDAQVLAVAWCLEQLGQEPVFIASDALDGGLPLTFDGGVPIYQGRALGELRACYVRTVPAAFAPAMPEDGGWVLFDDWFVHYMHARERASVYAAWLLALERAGAYLMNPLQCASPLQLKPFQLEALRRGGARVPRTLISNDPEAISRFGALGPTIYKPVMGGAITRRLDAAALERLDEVRRAPVIFQEQVPGDDVRVVLVDGRVVSSVAIVTPEQHLDFRDDPVYSSGGADYREVELPAAIERQCLDAARACGLTLAGVDLKHSGDDWVFLELNSSPIYLDVEMKLGHRISAAVAAALAQRAQGQTV